MRKLLCMSLLLLSGCGVTTYPSPDVVPVGVSATESGVGRTVYLHRQMQDGQTRWCLYREKFVMYRVKSTPKTYCPRKIKLM